MKADTGYLLKMSRTQKVKTPTGADSALKIKKVA